jgi:hypothetical protein
MNRIHQHTIYDMLSHEILEQLKIPALKEVCRGYKIASSGNKSELFERIIAHQVKLEKKCEKWDALMAHGVVKRDEGFERVIQVFQQWSDENGFWPSKLSESGVSYEYVHINEIRAAFADYAPCKSPLREDRLVPVPGTKLEVFLEMLFNERDDWEIFDTTTQEREFDCGSEFSDRWLVEGMKKLYGDSEPPQWCASSYANRY